RVAGLSRGGGAPAGVLGLTADLSDWSQTEAALAQAEAAHGPIEVLICNAGVTRDGLIVRLSDQAWDEVLTVDLTAPFKLARRLARPMARQRFGRIVFISSVVALLGSAGQTNYAAAKAGLIGLARSLARELGGRGVTVNVVTPGFITTDMTAVLEPAQVEAYAERVPLGRLGQAADVAGAVDFLTSDQASYVTGAVLPVDGGLGMGH
ncbi:MAG: SDR family oxidoreductase, partial [Propionibacteriaceae bacterium]|nr:SDR family oxidoreductase [Propionibacteriaceae bacterium]